MGERMTREEEIKARLDNDDYMDPGKFLDQASDDLRYLLARNEELQRRVERLENGILSALDYWNRCEELGAMSDALYEIENRLNAALDATLPVPQEVEVVTEVEDE